MDMPYASNKGAKIYWEESGTGEPLLLIMGLGYPHEMWHRTGVRWFPRTTGRFYLDNRGVGRSDVPPGPYSIAQMAEDAATVLDAAGVAKAHIFGVSMGGMIAQEFAIKFPERVNRLVLGCTSCGGRNSISASQNVLDVLMARAKMTPDEGAKAMVPYIYDSSTPREWVEEDLEIRRRCYPTAEGYMNQVQAILAWTSFDRLAQIRVPTLIIHGETDQLIPAGNGPILVQSIAGSSLVMLPRQPYLRHGPTRGLAS